MANIEELERQKNEFEASLQKVFVLGANAKLSDKDWNNLKNAPELMEVLIKAVLEHRNELTNVKKELNTYKHKL